MASLTAISTSTQTSLKGLFTYHRGKIGEVVRKVLADTKYEFESFEDDWTMDDDLYNQLMDLICPKWHMERGLASEAMVASHVSATGFFPKAFCVPCIAFTS